MIERYSVRDILCTAFERKALPKMIQLGKTSFLRTSNIILLLSILDNFIQWTPYSAGRERDRERAYPKSNCICKEDLGQTWSDMVKPGLL